jgi:hypothetical protein
MLRRKEQNVWKNSEKEKRKRKKRISSIIHERTLPRTGLDNSTPERDSPKI